MEGSPFDLASSHISKHKRFLVLSPEQGRFERFVDQVASHPKAALILEGRTPRVGYDGIEIDLMVERDASSTLLRLRELYFNSLLIDLRWPQGGAAEFERNLAAVRGLLTNLDDADDLEARYGFHRIVVLLSGPDAEAIDLLIAEFGHRGVGLVLVDRDTAPDRRFGGRVLEQVVELVQRPRREKRALCAAGGGVTGIYFHVGALKCLEDCLQQTTINTFDMYFGISAGAVVGGLLSVGYSVDEMMSALDGRHLGRIPPLSLRLLSLAHLNYPDLVRRMGQAAGSAWRTFWSVFKSGVSDSLQNAIFEYGDIIGAPFTSERFERTLRDIFLAPGSTNDFRKLKTKLFIGASDQDARKHVLFGADGADKIPISRAIQASLSVNPAFSSVPINGRYYEDGAVTRTSNFVEAIRRGAGLVVVLDPFVPYVSKEPGFVAERGVLYNVDQDIRTVSFTRFENTRNCVLRQYPNISSYTFLPANRLRRLLSVNPMDHRPYLQIWRGAYLSTLYRIKRLLHRMRGDWIAYGIDLNLEHAELVAEQLMATPTPSFEDFFPDRKVKISMPPLAMEQSERTTASV